MIPFFPTDFNELKPEVVEIVNGVVKIKYHTEKGASGEIGSRSLTGIIYVSVDKAKEMFDTDLSRAEAQLNKLQTKINFAKTEKAKISIK